MTYKASDKFTPYDWWFDKNIPSAQYGSLQCWIHEDKKEYINAYDMLLGSCYYQIKWGCGSEENLARGHYK